MTGDQYTERREVGKFTLWERLGQLKAGEARFAVTETKGDGTIVHEAGQYSKAVRWAKGKMNEQRA